MSSANFTKDFKIIGYKRGTSPDEYQNMANNSGMHAVYVEIASYEDYLSFFGVSDNSSERRHYQAMLKAPEDYNFDPRLKRNTYYFGAYNNNPEYERWWYATGGSQTNGGGDAVDKITRFSDDSNSLSGQSDFKFGLMGGDDFLEVTGGVDNFANGNNGQDHIVIKGGKGRYLGGADNDRLEVIGANAGSFVNGNRGEDIVIGSVDDVTYRGGSENDTLQVSAGKVWGDKGADTFKAVGGAGVAIVEDYTVGEDFVKGVVGGGFQLTDQGLFYGTGGDQMLLLLNINEASQVRLI